MKHAIYFDAARDICRRHARSFYFASHFLPEPKRNHAYAVYAFCRLLDDAVDEVGEPIRGVENLVYFDELLEGIYEGRVPDEPIERDRALRAFEITIRNCDIPRRHFETLAEGCRMDLSVTRYPDWPALERYCYHVAGVVGLIMCYVFDLHDPSAHSRAIAMGNAMQLTNILRDVGEDFDRGRIYLPADEMTRFGVDEGTLTRRSPTDGFVELMRFQIARARSLYRQGADGLAMIDDDGSRMTASVMAVVYGGILGAIERSGYNVLRERVHLSSFQKLVRLPAALQLTRLDPGDPVPDVF